MRTTYRVFAYLIAAAVVVQAMAIAYALAGLGKWIEDDHGVLNKQVLDNEDLHFRGSGGFALHAIDGMMIIPALALLFVIISFFAKVPGGSKRAGIIFGLIVLQVILGFTLHGVPLVAPLHVLNAFIILGVAIMSGQRAAAATSYAPAEATPQPAMG
jgi:hypothetical protein